MEFSDGDPAFRARFLDPKFEPESFVQSIGKLNIKRNYFYSIALFV